jgi:hypothetical protein
MWTLRDIQEYIDLIVKQDPKMLDAQVIMERPETWRGYHLSDGCAKRGQHGKPDKIVFRCPKGMIE